MVSFPLVIPRNEQVEAVLGRLKSFPAVAILGPRQIGKTTLARQVARQAASPVHWLDLENPADLNRLLDDPLLVLDELRGLGLGEVGYHRINRRWLRGGFPQAWLARSNATASLWIESFVRTFLERDLPELGLRVPSAALRRFWTMLAHWHGQVWKASEFARSLGVADTTVRRYLDILTGALVVRQLQPWHENIAKRQVKSPKLYLRDSGVLHALLGIGDLRALNAHPKCGASWEGLMLESVIEQLGLSNEQAFFWAVHTGAELDLLVPRGRHRVGIEIKRTAAPKVTRSMRTAIDDLNLREVVVIHAGRESYRLAAKVRAVAASRLDADLGL